MDRKELRTLTSDIFVALATVPGWLQTMRTVQVLSPSAYLKGLRAVETVLAERLKVPSQEELLSAMSVEELLAHAQKLTAELSAAPSLTPEDAAHMSLEVIACKARAATLELEARKAQEPTQEQAGADGP